MGLVSQVELCKLITKLAVNVTTIEIILPVLFAHLQATIFLETVPVTDIQFASQCICDLVTNSISANTINSEFYVGGLVRPLLVAMLKIGPRGSPLLEPAVLQPLVLAIRIACQNLPIEAQQTLYQDMTLVFMEHSFTASLVADVTLADVNFDLITSPAVVIYMAILTALRR